MGLFQRVTSLVMVLGLSVSGVVGVSSSASADEARVIAPYYAGWEQGNLAPGALPWEAMSHVIHFSVLPTASGGLDDATNGVSASRARALVSEARKHDTKVLISVGGTPGSEHWPAAASATNRARFVDNLVELMASRGYDGVDLNWEGNVDQADYLAVMRQLREALDARGNGELLTAAFYGSWNTLAARAHPLLDWASMMTYLPYGQPANSHNSPLHGSQYARIDNLVSSWLAAGVPANKIVPGVATYASEWRNDQLVTPEMPYRTAAAKGYTSGLAWDATARASAWRSATTFVSIEDDRAIKAKADYLDTQGLRGLIVWELGTGRHNGTIPVMDSIRTHLPLTTPNVDVPPADPDDPPMEPTEPPEPTEPNEPTEPGEPTPPETSPETSPEPELTLSFDKVIYKRVWRSTLTASGPLADGTTVDFAFRTANGVSGTRSCTIRSGTCTTAFVQAMTNDAWVTYTRPDGQSITIHR
jgi:chitinase